MEIDMAGLEMKYAAEQRFERAQEELQTMWDEAEDEIRRIREMNERRSQDLQQWEKDVADRRSEGHFFKSLYQAPKSSRSGKILAASVRGPRGSQPRASEERDMYGRPRRAAAPARDLVSFNRAPFVLWGSVILFLLAYELVAAEQPNAYTLGACVFAGWYTVALYIRAESVAAGGNRPPPSHHLYLVTGALLALCFAYELLADGQPNALYLGGLGLWGLGLGASYYQQSRRGG